MKKTFKIFSLLFMVISFALTGILFLNEKFASADDIVSPDEYYDAVLTQLDADGKYEDIAPSKNLSTNDCAAYFVTKNNNAVTVYFGFGNNYKNNISNLVLKITINGNTFDVYGSSATGQLVSHGMEISDVEDNYFALRINPKIASENGFA